MAQILPPGPSNEWAYRRVVALDFIGPGKPSENGMLNRSVELARIVIMRRQILGPSQ